MGLEVRVQRLEVTGQLGFFNIWVVFFEGWGALKLHLNN